MPVLTKKIPAVAALLFFLCPVWAFAEDKVPVYFFKADGCPHCAKEEIFLQKLKEKNPKVEIKEYEITKNGNNLKLLQKLAEELSINITGVPVTFVGNRYFIGYQDDQTHGALIEQMVEDHEEGKCPDIAGPIVNEFEESCKETEKTGATTMPATISIPFLGKISPKDFSLPLLTLIIAGIDGFNPCAMWTLIFLIGLLLQMKNRKRMWILGAAFIVSSAAVYFLFLAAWLNLFLFLGFIFWVRLIVGLVAITAGAYYLKKFFKKKADVCEISETEKHQKIFDKLKKITQKERFWAALAGIILIAAAVNLIELICSAGLPAIYTQLLSLSQLSKSQYYLYLLFYVIIFMLDDMIIFFGAMLTLKAKNFSSKYSRVSALVGGVLMILVGLLLIFKPGILMFG